jgi:signal transduction histidine kinase
LWPYRLDMAAREADPATRDRITASANTLRAALDRTRKLMFDLRPPLLHEHGLRPAVEELGRQLSGEAAAQVDCHGCRRR